MPADLMYDPLTFARETPEDELPSTFCSVYHSLGLTSTKRDNLHYLDDGMTLMYSAGNFVHFVSLKTLQQTYLSSLGGCGIGAVTVHPAKQHICVADAGRVAFGAGVVDVMTLIYSLIRHNQNGIKRIYKFKSPDQVHARQSNQFTEYRKYIYAPAYPDLSV